MKLVVDTNVVISAPITDSRTRELIVILEPNLQTPAFIHNEVENYEALIVAKSGMEPERVAQFIDLLFQYIEVIPADDFYPAIEAAEAAIGDTDPDDVPYLACTIATGAAVSVASSVAVGLSVSVAVSVVVLFPPGVEVLFSPPLVPFPLPFPPLSLQPTRNVAAPVPARVITRRRSLLL